MNVNGSRYHLLYGKDDWGECTVMLADKRRKLAAQWKLTIPPAGVPVWSDDRGYLGLEQLDTELPATQGEQAYLPADRRGLAADAYGNIYVVSDTGHGIDVFSRDGNATSAFWPASVSRRRRQPGDFSAADPDPGFDGAIAGLAITSESYLVAAFATGLLRFDLVGGGPPERFAFPAALGPITPTDIAPGPCCGLWLLDGAAARLYRLDRNLAFVEAAGNAAIPSVFQPATGPATRNDRPSAAAIVPLPAGIDPLAIVATDHFEAILLCADGDATRLLIVAPGDTAAGVLIDVPHACYCLAALPTKAGEDLMLADVDGNQAHRVFLTRPDTGLSVKLDPTTIPMRRFGGRGLVAANGYVLYDSGPLAPLWVPLLAQKRQSYAGANTILSPLFDSQVPQCVWDRIRIDGCIPPGTSVTIEARASDDLALMGAAAEIGWTLQPRPYLNRDGGELPGKRDTAGSVTNPAAGLGCWDVLLQGVTGRYCELRITLGGDGRFTPHLRALRLWYPRFSWPARFLPGVYREDPAPADFLERFLANMEGIDTVAEGRIAAAQILFDTRIAPADTLDWLAGWYDMALDPRWDENRKRLFVRNAARFFGWRGTARGIDAALRLAFDAAPDDSLFALEQRQCQPANGVRIVEGFSTRSPLPTWPAGEADGSLPAQDQASATWSPAEGAQGLARRWAQATTGVVPAQLPASVDLDPTAHTEGDWAVFAAAQIGFVPVAGAAERVRWIAFQQATGVATPMTTLPVGSVPAAAHDAWRAFTALASRERTLWVRWLTETYRRIGRLNAAWNTAWDDFGEVALPDRVPDTAPAIRDWLVFEGQILAVDASAHRFSVLLPRRSVDQGYDEEQDMLAIAKRLVAIEKPAHTTFDVRFYWAMNRVGEARAGIDTQLGQGSRAPELVPTATIGRAYLGASFIGGPGDPGPRRSVLAC
jgi:phage tail-like protein